MAKVQMEYYEPGELTPYAQNARTHSYKQIQQIATSIEIFGFLNPILIDENLMIIAGHGRVEAAKKLGINKIPVRKITHLSENEKRAYIIADNKIAEKAGWDDDILAIELQHLLEIDEDFDVSITGFEMAEIDLLILEDGANESCLNPIIPKLAEEAVTQIGDMWILGDHKILCGDSLEAKSYDCLLKSEKAQMIFTDPPYNVPISGHVCGNGKIQHREFAMASGEMSREEFILFLSKVFKNLKTYSKNGSIHFICMDWRHMSEILDAGNQHYTELKNLCVWNKDNGGMGSLYRSKHELVFVFKNGEGSHINNVELGKHGRYRTNVWDYSGVNTIRSDKKKELTMHPTVKPTAMIADAMLDCSNYGDIVLDCFGGSGSTLMAAERVKRKARLIELDPLYVDVSIKRWEEHTSQDAIHEQSGLTFQEISKGSRCNE